jgi:DNA-binding response OmpR family regulator
MVTSKQTGRSEAAAAGASDFLTKPFTVEELLPHIESALRR